LSPPSKGERTVRDEWENSKEEKRESPETNGRRGKRNEKKRKLLKNKNS